MGKPISLANIKVPMNHRAEWEILRDQAQGNRDFDALEVKAFYVYGLIYDVCQSVNCLVAQNNAWPDLYLPAYAVFASGIELLGRCVRGDASDSGQSGNNLKAGFNYLATQQPDVPSSPESVNVTMTSHHTYTIRDLVALRNFTAHGQAANNQLPGRIDPELLSRFSSVIGNAMETYWEMLQTSSEYCEKLGTANVRPLQNRSAPIEKILYFFSQGSAGEPFFAFDWSVNS